MAEDIVLLPCPFCGSGDLSFSERPRPWGVECHECFAVGPEHDCKADALSAWNTRYEAAEITALRKERDELRRIVAELGYCTPDASLEFMALIPAEVRAAHGERTG